MSSAVSRPRPVRRCASTSGAAVSDIHGAAPRFNQAEPRLSGLIASAPGLHARILERLADEQP